MSNLTVSSDAVAALLRRLEAGESLDQVLQPQVPADEAAVLMRAAVPRTFDAGLFTAILATPGGPSLQDLAERGRIEPVAGATDRYRVRPDLVADLFGRWWPAGKVPTRPTPPPPDLKRLLTRLVTFHTKRNEHLEALYHLVLIDQARATKRFDTLFARADREFDLAGCQDVIAAVGLQVRNTLIGSGLRKRVNDRVRYLRVRGDHAADYYRTARFFEPAGFRTQIDSFLTGRSTRVVQVVAEGGMGKTMRLRWFIARKCVIEQIPVARIDFDDVDPVVAGTDPWLVLLEIALQLHDQLPGTPFDKLRSDFGEYRPLLRRGTREDGRPGSDVDLVDVRRRAEVEVPERVRAGLAESVGDRTAVLILDTTEELVVPVERNVSGLWDQLDALLDERSGLRLILAGRYDLAGRSAAFAGAFPKARVRQLEPFSARQSAAYLRSRGITDAALIKAMVAKSKGRPFKLALFGDIVHLGSGLTASDVAAYREPDLLFLVARVLDRITDPGVRWLLRYGVIPRRLTLGLAMGPLAPFLARGMAGDPTFDDPTSDGTPPARRIDGPAFPTGIVEPGAKPPVEELWRTLREYAASASWVSMEDADTLRFQPEVIEPMRQVLRGKPAWAILQDAAATWFERRADEDPEHWGEWIAEAAYHRFQRDGEEAVAWWREQLDRARALARTDWLRRLAEEAPRTAEGEPGGVPPPASAGAPSERVPDSTVIAEFELAALEVAEARRRRASRSDGTWKSAGQRLDRAIALDNGRDLIPAMRLASVRAALAYGRGQPEVALQEIAQARSLGPGTRDEADLTTLQAEILADAGEPDLGGPIGVALAAITALARVDDRTWNATIELGIGVLAAAALRNDRLVEAIRVYEYTLKILRPDPARRTDIQLTLADLEIRSGQPGRAIERLESVGLAEADRGQWLRREVIRARAELTARRPHEAIRIATDVIEGLNVDVLGADALTDPLELEATAREVRGDALVSVMLFSAALDDLDRARTTWSIRHDPEGVCRTLVTAITAQLRGRGDLNQARQLLDGLESASPPVGGDAWTDGQLRRAEWYARTGNSDRAGEIIDETQRSLAELMASPARRTRVALAGLALEDSADRDRHARTLADTLGTIEPVSFRLALLRDLESIPGFGDAIAGNALQGTLKVASEAEPLGSQTDQFLAQLRLVEVERVAGQRDQALARLRRLASQLARLQLWTALTTSIDAALRLEDPELALAIRDVAERGDPSAAGGWPTDRAARLARLAGAALSGHRLDQAQAMLEEAERLVEDPRSATAARILVVQGIVAEMTGRDADAVAARRSAAEIYRALGDLVAAAEVVAPPLPVVAGTTGPGDATTSVEGPDPVIRIRVDVRGRDLEVRVYSPNVGPAPEPGPRARFPDAIGAVGRLDDPDAPPERALKEAMERLAADWHAYGRDLGSYLAPAGVDRAQQVSVGPVGVTIEVMNHLLPPIPWELASIDGRNAIVLDPQVAWFARIQPAGTIDENVRYAQATLARVTGVAIVADGIPGPATAEAVRRFQLDAGLPDHGMVDAETLGALRRRALDADTFPPRVVLVRTAFDRQVASRSVGYETDYGVDLYRLYDAAGYRVELLDTPTIEGLAAFTSDPSTAIVHLGAGIRLTSGGIVSLDFAEAGFSKTRREGPELTASVVGRVLAGGGEGPLVVVDVPRPSSPSEAARQLMFRNRFAADLFESGSVSAVVATGLMEFATSDSHAILFDGLRRGDSVADACAAARRVSASGVDQLAGLPDAAALAAIALFARTPDSGIGLGRVAS